MPRFRTILNTLHTENTTVICSGVCVLMNLESHFYVCHLRLWAKTSGLGFPGWLNHTVVVLLQHSYARVISITLILSMLFYLNIYIMSSLQWDMSENEVPVWHFPQRQRVRIAVLGACFSCAVSSAFSFLLTVWCLCIDESRSGEGSWLACRLY